MSLEKVQEAFASARLVVLLVAMLSLCVIGYYRLELYIKNIIIHESTMKDIGEAWFDMSLCYGPKYSLETISIYLKANELRQIHPDSWKEMVRRTDFRRTQVHGADAITSIEKYRNFFIHKFNWSIDDMHDVGHSVNVESLGVGWYKHSFADNRTKFAVNFNFNTFLYSWCYNYTYKNMFTDHYQSANAMKKGKSLEDPYHRVGIYDHQYEWHFGGNGVSEHVDVYVYPKGHEFEFPLIEDRVPFRIDMREWQRLQISARKLVRQNRPNFNCIDQESLGDNKTYSYNLCLTWCLRRTLLNHIKCTTPEIDRYIFNISQAIGTYMETPPKKREVFRSSVYFNKDSAWPWMKEYLYLKPCDTAQSFLETFQVFEKVFYPRGDKFAMNSSCGTECPRECIEYDVLISPEGPELHPPTEGLHGVTIAHSARVEEVREKWKYTISQLLIDLSGVMSFLLGLSLIAIHEWCFVLTKWLVQRHTSPHQPPPPPELSYLRDDMRYDDYHEYADDYYDYERRQSSRRFYPEDYDYYDGYYDDYDEEYDEYGDYGDEYHEEHYDYAGDEKVLEATHSDIMYDHGLAAATGKNKFQTKQSHLSP